MPKKSPKHSKTTKASPKKSRDGAVKLVPGNSCTVDKIEKKIEAHVEKIPDAVKAQDNPACGGLINVVNTSPPPDTVKGKPEGSWVEYATIVGGGCYPRIIDRVCHLWLPPFFTKCYTVAG